MLVVIAGRPAADAPFQWLETDHDRGISLGVEHLVRLGHERIAFLGGPEAYEFVQRRFARWREALRTAGLDAEPATFAGADLSLAAGIVLAHAPTAVICTSDTLAIALVAAARDGLSVPNDLSVIGFDDSLLAALSSPALTSVRIDYTEFGAAASAALLAEIDGLEAPPYTPSPPLLEVRASTASATPRMQIR